MPITECLMSEKISEIVAKYRNIVIIECLELFGKVKCATLDCISGCTIRFSDLIESGDRVAVHQQLNFTNKLDMLFINSIEHIS